MTNPYAGTPLWAKWYSLEMDWPVTAAVLNAADGALHCDGCGSPTTHDPELLGSETASRPLELDRDYCFGCGAVVCDGCVPEGYGPHGQAVHYPSALPIPVAS